MISTIKQYAHIKCNPKNIIRKKEQYGLGLHPYDLNRCVLTH